MEEQQVKYKVYSNSESLLNKVYEVISLTPAEKKHFEAVGFIVKRPVKEKAEKHKS